MPSTSETPNLVTPAPESIAFFVRTQRGILHWKQETLAAMADVSHSTIQRVERGETVTPDCLTKIAVALGRPADYLTAPRQKLTEEQAWESLQQSVAWMDGLVEVPVAPLTKERQLRELASTDMIVIGSYLDEEAQGDIDGLREWIDLTGFVRATAAGDIGPKPERGFRMRELYDDLFQHLTQLQARHQAVCLVGTYTAETDSRALPTATVAVLSLRSKKRNPAAAKLKTVWCQQKVSWKDAMEHTR
ncbi:helix-turn-helix domain-containing protein [Sphingopyxis sp. EG6]|uniref:helix-turn-helix domain-containing protein n=1 Tax=Sphingopyxis sp. EG6 TaxID=1874061 RepID=UPI000E7413B7|nr:helix-turn-helix transcriptional regulator [Sphingopyxis sp. EG6]